MSGIQASTGLISGIPIEDTVDQLMAIASRRRDLVTDRNKLVTAERAAVDQVSSLLLGFRFAANRLKQSSVFSSTSFNSNNPSAISLSKVAGATPTPGNYQVAPLQLASSHGVASQSYATPESVPTSGSLSLRIGGHVDKGIDLDQLNSGGGVAPGSIRITDRSGNTADVDLRTARSIDEVVAAISNGADIEVTASIDGDRLVLTDTSGGTGNLRVRDIGTGTTAADLGLANINVAANSASGTDIYSLHSGTRLSTLNDGNGVQLRANIDDLEVSLADGTALQIDLGDSDTLGEVVAAINAENNAKLTAAISSDGRRLVLTDLTTGSGTFEVANIGTGTAADDLGLTTTASGNTLTGDRLVAGLSDTLLSSLNGGRGLGDLGEITITDRSGDDDTIDLGAAETLGDVISLINAANVDVTASVNATRDGIVLTDTSGGSGNLSIVNADSNDTVEALGIGVGSATSSVDSGTLRRQTISQSTLLSSLNGGRGVAAGDIRITDSSGVAVNVSLDTPGSEAVTIGDVIDKINAAAPNVEARINDRGDGIVLEDKAASTGSLTVAEVGGRSTASDLRLLGSSTTTNIAGEKIIDGSTTLDIDLSTISTGAGNVALNSLRNGQGISLGVFTIKDASGKTAIIDLGEAGNEAFTFADVIDKINAAATAAGADITADLTSAGTAIRLTDSSGGTGKLTVTDLGSGTAAADLGLAKTATTSSGNQIINGANLLTAAQASATGLDAIATRINQSQLGITAETVNDGTGTRLVITSGQSGRAGELLVRGLSAGLSFEETSPPQDALLQVGGTSGLVASSSSNQFENVVPGLRITASQVVTTGSVSVTVAADNSTVLDAAADLVDSYNSLRTTLNNLASFDAEDLSTGILFGRGEVVRIDNDLGRLLSGRISGVGSLSSLEALGIRLTATGELELDEAQLQDAFADDPTAVQQFFTSDTNGFAARLTSTIDQLAGDENSLLTRRSETLQQSIDTNQERIDTMTAQLDRERDRMLLDFYRLEETIAKIQASLTSIESITAIEPLSFAR